MMLDSNPTGVPLLGPLSLVSLSQLLTPRLCLITTLAAILLAQYVRSPWRKVPPGPKGLPILGNAVQLQNRGWMFERECKHKFEHIMYLTAIGQPIIVLNSLKAAFELLDRRANIYSDRPRQIIADILCGGRLIALMPYGDDWRRIRRAAHEVLTKVAVRDYQPVYSKEAILLAVAMLEDSDALDKHIQRAAASATMSILYDYPTLENLYDKTLVGIQTFISRMSAAAAPGAYLLVSLFPWTIHIPERLAKWKREVMDHSRQHLSLFHALLKTVSDDIVSRYFPHALNILRVEPLSYQAKGSDRSSVGASLIRNSSRNGLSKNDMAWFLGSLYSAGSETSATTLAWWTRAMIAYPDMQKRAQDELDAVVGRSRTPTYADAPNLHYIQAMVKEALRWRPAFPLNIPHTSMQDDWYEGMFIPKGTVCMVNLWQCHHDPAIYGPDAASFNPDRYLDEHGKLIPGPAETRDDGHSSFGFGRRSCVGKHAANDSLFINIATMLWAARLEHGQDETGKEIPVNAETPIDIGMVFRPLPYKCKITPRFPETPTLLMEEIEMLKA